jgi:hypothetical protein
VRLGAWNLELGASCGGSHGADRGSPQSTTTARQQGYAQPQRRHLLPSVATISSQALRREPLATNQPYPGMKRDRKAARGASRERGDARKTLCDLIRFANLHVNQMDSLAAVFVIADRDDAMIVAFANAIDLRAALGID